MEIENTPVEIMYQAIDVGTLLEYPIKKWLDLNNDSFAELKLFNMVFSWNFLAENNLIEPSIENAKFYFGLAHRKIELLKPSLSFDDFYELFKDRLINYSDELTEVFKAQSNSNTFFPKYFFSKLISTPLSLTESNNVFNVEHLSEHELYGMYAHQINFLQENLKKEFNKN